MRRTWLRRRVVSYCYWRLRDITLLLLRHCRLQHPMKLLTARVRGVFSDMPGWLPLPPEIGLLSVYVYEFRGSPICCDMYLRDPPNRLIVRLRHVVHTDCRSSAFNVL